MSNKCYTCKREEESVDHILLHYLKAVILWYNMYALFGMEWVMHSSRRKALLH